ncbi:MAG TPA: helix-turn-helix domain-containing protein [candidate division Zixibacteria bacterium]|nr:helix-turn-helix domain-containing protein [candidate division Zixibacteria bacterium]
MSANDEPYSTIFASLKHPIRRSILRMLSKKTMSFSEMLEVLGVSSSILTYHLENLGELAGKTGDGKYRLSSFGEAAMATMTKVEDIPATALQQSAETKPKKMNNRSIALALGTICIILIASLGVAMAYYTMTINSKDATISKLNATMANEINTIASLNANITNLTNERNQLQTWLDGNETLLSQTQANNTSLQNQNANLTSEMEFIINPTVASILFLNESLVLYNQTISQPADSYTDIPFLAWNAGYFSVNVTSSTTETTYVETIWSARGINYNNTITVGTNGTAVFPYVPEAPSTREILYLGAGPAAPPAWPPDITIRVGNINTVDNATETVTITYYF